MDKEEDKKKRKQYKAIIVYCKNEEERKRLKEIASEYNMTASTYLLTVGLGYKPSSIIDTKEIEKIVDIGIDIKKGSGIMKQLRANNLLSAEEVNEYFELQKKALKKIINNIDNILAYTGRGK